MWTNKQHNASTTHVSLPIFPSLACFSILITAPSTLIANKQTKKNNPKWKRWIQQICQLGQHVKTAAKISLAKQTSIQAGCRCECSISIWKYKSDCIFYVALWTWSHIKATYGTFSNVFYHPWSTSLLHIPSPSPVWQACVVALRSIWLLTETVKLCKEGRVAQTVRLQGCRGEVRPRWTRLAGGPICLPKAFSANMYLIKWTACRQRRDRKSDCCVMMNALISSACHGWRLNWGM